MRTLEESLRDLTRLDEIRVEAVKFRTEGLAALRKIAPHLPKTDQKIWGELGAGGEDALVLKALSTGEAGGTVPERLVREIGSTNAADIFGDGATGIFIGSTKIPLPYLRAARCLSALASAPTGAFIAPSFMLFYYAVIRELYTAAPPDWSIGGARGAPRGKSSAYVTSEFVRGLSTFARSLDRTATYVAALAEVQETGRMEGAALEPWYVEDRRRRGLFLYTTLRKRSWNLAVHLPKPLPPQYDDKALDVFQSGIRTDLVQALENSRNTFQDAYDRVNVFRSSEKIDCDKKGTQEARRAYDRSESAHSFARDAVYDAVRLATEASGIFARTGDPNDPPAKAAQLFAEELGKLEKLFHTAAARVRRLLAPAETYLSSVLDRQITAALTTSQSGITFDPIEMACAAATVASTSGDASTDAIVRAADCLTKILTDDGFPLGRPFYQTPGTYYHPSQYYALRSYGQLLTFVPDSHLDVAALESVLRFFRKKRRPVPLEEGQSGWSGDKRGPLNVLDTALATLALDRLVRMLDDRINAAVLAQFSHQHPKKLRLRDLFYPDYGAASASVDGSPERSLAVVLERMSAHVSAVPLEKPFTKPLYSAVFYGPPGTGKTTLAEALAASCEVPLVEVTPSDIVVRGAEFVEERARVVFKALSLLTSAVILFDEFEEVLVNRKQPANTTRTIFHFLTPGMLPKLKTLSEQAKKRRVAYVLLTNDDTRLDEAAIRPGRFDEKLGVYPPDLLSRAGRLLTIVQRHAVAKNLVLTPECKARCAKAIREARLAPMETIGQPGWYSPPRDNAIEDDTLFDYIFNGAREPAWPKQTFGAVDRKLRKEGVRDWCDDQRIKTITEWDDSHGHAPWMPDIVRLLDEWSGKPPRKRATV